MSRMSWQEWLSAKDWISSSGGKHIYFADPGRSEWTWEDVTEGLAHECRFAGQVGKHYSVAEHSLKVTAILRARGYPRSIQIAALLHDASEAFLKDIPRPMKARLVALSEYGEWEQAWTYAIYERAGIMPAMPPEVRAVDSEILAAELRHLKPETAAEIDDLPPDPPELRGGFWGHGYDAARVMFESKLFVLGVL